MALIVFHTNKARTLTHEQALLLDKVKRGLIKGSPRQQTFAKRVKKIYFSKQHEEIEKPLAPEWWNR